MNIKKNLIILALLCSALFTSCHAVNKTSEIIDTYEPISALVEYPTETELTSTPTVDYTQNESQPPIPPVDISKVTFNLTDLKDYLTFDKDGLIMPEIKMLYEKERIEYNNRKMPDYVQFSPEFYLRVAEYDMNNDGKTDYIVKRPDSSRSGGMRFDEAFFDVLCTQPDGTLKKMCGDSNLLLVSENPMALLSTTHNGLYDILVPNGHSSVPIYEFNGANYDYWYIDDENSVGYDNWGSSSDINFKLEKDKLKLGYSLRLYMDDYNKDYRFFVAGLFTTANKEGIIKENRLWACDEGGNPELFSTKDESLWAGIVFNGEYAGADLLLYEDDLIWPDELKIIMYEPE